MKKSRISSKQETYYVKVASHSPIFHENMRSFHINTQTLNQQAQKFKQQFCQYHKIIGKSCAHLSTIKVQILYTMLTRRTERLKGGLKML